MNFSKDLVLVRWQEDYGNEENLNDIPYAQMVLDRRYASVLSGHRVLCEDCANQLGNNFCPKSNGVIRIWQYFCFNLAVYLE
ncbi:RING-type domain-containing protein, partial [Aphis craccivora]